MTNKAEERNPNKRRTARGIYSEGVLDGTYILMLQQQESLMFV